MSYIICNSDGYEIGKYSDELETVRRYAQERANNTGEPLEIIPASECGNTEYQGEIIEPMTA